MIQSKSTPTGGVAVARRAGRLELPCRLHEWELVALAAEGSLARVFRARPIDSPADRPAVYALKTLRPPWEEDPRAVGLLVREATVGRQVSHPHLIPILAAGLGRSPRYVVMPFLQGARLAAPLAAGVNFDPPTALWLARQTAEALQSLHAAGWMHGDIKPGNIFVSPQGHVTLLDLGFARRRDETGSAVDRCVLGTGSYLAPEWITSALRADIRSDIYSLGVTLFELLAGRLPFTGETLAELAVQHKQSAPPDLHHLAPHVPAAIVQLVHQMLAKEPLRRPQTPAELVERLAALEIATFAERAWE